MFILFAVSLLVACVHATFQPANASFKSPVTVAQGFAAHVIFSNLTAPRGITFDDCDNLLVVERGLGITAFTQLPDLSGWERTVVIQNTNFTQGIQVFRGHLYASTAGQVLRFAYDSVNKTVSGDPEVIVTGLPPDGELTTHTLQFENTGPEVNLFVDSGPLTNIDPTARDPASGRSQIRRFTLDLSQPSQPQQYFSGALVAFGLRNANGFAFSPSPPQSQKLYVVENGASIDSAIFTTAFANDNPADELNLVDLQAPPVSYGFPDCTTLWNPVADPAGDPQYVNLSVGAQISLQLDPARDDAWCSNATNNKPPTLSFQAHFVPLDIKFYTPPENASTTSQAFPATFACDAFVSSHGSFSRIPPTGYGIAHVPFTNGAPASQNYTFLIQAANLSSCPGKCIRPVGLAFGRDGRLYASSDSSRELFVLENLN